jgi:hypothetical protein
LHNFHIVLLQPITHGAPYSILLSSLIALGTTYRWSEFQCAHETSRLKGDLEGTYSQL